MTDVIDEIGPIDYLVVEYSREPDGSALPALIDLVERGIIRVLDVAFVKRGQDESYAVATLDDLVASGVEGFDVFDGAATGMLEDSDLEQVAAVLNPGTFGAILVYENSWAAPFAVALRRAGAQLVAGGHIPVQSIVAALEDE